MKAKELSEVLKDIVDFLDKYPYVEVNLSNNIYSHEDECLLDLKAEFDVIKSIINLSTF